MPSSNKPTDGWWKRFKLRHPTVTTRKGESLSKARMAATTQKALDKYFDQLKATLTRNGLMNKLGQIFNCDESGFPLDHKVGKIATRKGQKHTYSITSGNKTQITVMACVSAAGFAMPPMIIFDRKGLNPEWTEGEISCSRYGLNESGWINSDLFDGWYEEVFLKLIPAVRPILLLLDGHSTHYNPVTIKRAASDNVIIFCLPPNTTHLMQPLDQVCFSVLKKCWNEECLKYTQLNPGKVVTRTNFSQVFQSAWAKAMTISNITASFKTTGIHLFNRHAITLPQNRSPSAKGEPYVSSGVAYIPFFSPSRPFPSDRSLEGDENESVVETTATVRSPLKAADAKSTPQFTDSELSLFHERYENGYDLLHDECYSLWLRHKHPEATILAQPKAVQGQPSTPAAPNVRLIGRPIKANVGLPPIPKPQVMATRTPTGKVLTSEDNLKQLTEKARRKEQDAK